MALAEFVHTEVLKPRPLRKLTNAILLRIIPEKVKVDPATLYLNPNDPVLSGALTLRVYEKSEIAFFKKHCREDIVFVDVGGNIGLYSALALHTLNSNGQIITLEPHPESFALLSKNVEVNQKARGTKDAPKINLFQMAASSQSGSRTLALNPENKADNRVSDAPKEWESIPIEAKSMDDLLAEQGIEEVNFVKIDVQGYEHRIISGFMETLRRSTKTILLTEFWPQGMKASGGDAHTYLQILSDLGFTLYELKERPLGHIEPLEDWQMLIARLHRRKYTNLIAVKGYEL
ncbi:MAG: FkbM family methyltransferase [Anaerolineae bacterium]|jgi:FkbM family methyltransferase|nr:FkbM family methyltransferase [Anaerolineae bacterium]MBT3714295.1 FkbM family methyltransferase [Anaerolineae bacterium]MBT4309433.1 FkbM family methyltransferase [Anaerolineae bacterium]MBT4458295.1 FkbM family methyltransferase [Anaerolineae bacterium]MBT6061822.1 FkbM family methyltransferase [Anaerolineae bacterium]